MSGTTQLSRNCGRLLSQVGAPKPIKEPENIEDLPLSSSDEDELSGSIRRTTFTKHSTTTSAAPGSQFGVKGKNSTKSIEKTSQQRPNRASKRTKPEDIDVDEDFFSGKKKKKAKYGSEAIASQVGGHMSSEALLFKKAGRANTKSKGYGKSSRSQNSTPKNNRQDRDLSPSESPMVQFKKHDEYGSIDSSPVKLKLSQRVKDEDMSSSGLSDPPSSDNSDPPRALNSRIKKQNLPRRGAKKGKAKQPEFSAEPMSQMPTFKMPEAYRDYAPAELVDLDITMNDAPVEKRQLDPGMALCPMCDEQVDAEMLKEFSGGKRMRVAQQAKFCRMHKRKSAEEETKYPKVDWTTLAARIERHEDYLRSVIMGKESHFGSKLMDNIRTGHARTLFTMDEYPTPGYYGLRGMSTMTDIVTETFSNLLRERAPVDKRISGRGYTGFVQSVLVPELAVKLIQEDMSLNEEEAREAMIASRSVGEILNDEKRESQTQGRTEIQKAGSDAEEEEEQEEQDEEDEEDNGVNSEKSDDDVPVDLRIEEVADSASDISRSPAHSQRQASIIGEEPREVDESDSDQNGPLLGGREPKEAQEAESDVKKQDLASLSVRASPKNNKNIKKTVSPTIEVDDSDDSDISELSSVLEDL